MVLGRDRRHRVWYAGAHAPAGPSGKQAAEARLASSWRSAGAGRWPRLPPSRLQRRGPTAPQERLLLEAGREGRRSRRAGARPSSCTRSCSSRYPADGLRGAGARRGRSAEEEAQARAPIHPAGVEDAGRIEGCLQLAMQPQRAPARAAWKTPADLSAAAEQRRMPAARAAAASRDLRLGAALQPAQRRRPIRSAARPARRAAASTAARPGATAARRRRRRDALARAGRARTRPPSATSLAAELAAARIDRRLGAREPHASSAVVPGAWPRSAAAGRPSRSSRRARRASAISKRSVRLARAARGSTLSETSAIRPSVPSEPASRRETS